ncbi:MAG: hypothetical protein FWF86_00225 [Clostridia bacterium]|nr:hypothetical protein [Clostridia bacterium]
MNPKTHQPPRHSAGIIALLFTLLAFAVPLTASGEDLQASGLEGPLSGWLGRWQPLRFTASLRVDGLLPFPNNRLDSLNALLRHVAIDAVLAEGAEESTTVLRLRCDQDPVMTIAEVQRSGVYTLQTDLLPNRALESRFASPLALLGGADGQEAAAPSSGSAEEKARSAIPTGSFDFLAAIDEADGCYRALINACEPYAVKKRVSHRIKDIGTARWSQTARLTPEQSDGMLPFLRNMLQCGMDDACREDLNQARFGKDLAVTLYKAGEKDKDMGVAMKGTLLYPDGSTSKLTYQWAFVNNGVQRKDSYKLETAPQKSARPALLAEGLMTQKRFEDDFSIQGSSQLTLRLGKASETRLTKVNLSGKEDGGGRGLKGSWTSQVKRAESKSASATTLFTATPDLRISAGPEGGRVSGQVQVERQLDKRIVSALCFTFAPADDSPALSAEADYSRIADLPPLPRDSAGPAVDPSADRPEESVDADVSLDLSFLVKDGPDPGSAPTGLKVHPVPADMTPLSLDDLTAENRLNLMDEMEQRLAGRLLIALSALPAEDIALLTDGLRESDLPAFPALFH